MNKCLYYYYYTNAFENDIFKLYDEVNKIKTVVVHAIKKCCSAPDKKCCSAHDKMLALS